ncbi:hypothetical protein GCM10018771_20600 [Streptomyces cellulosae]|nr:hypothetical protein GCM10018771_20600 [Streptomyces cellulosae]
MHDSGDSPCGHVRRVLADRLDNVRAQLAELGTLEAHLDDLLTHADQGQPTDHDKASVCWILEIEPAETNEALPAGSASDRGSTPAG